jgi:hypothetical protein
MLSPVILIVVMLIVAIKSNMPSVAIKPIMQSVALQSVALQSVALQNVTLRYVILKNVAAPLQRF